MSKKLQAKSIINDQLEDFSKQRQAEGTKNAVQILKIIANEELPTGQVTDKVYEAYKGVTEKIMAYLLEANVKYWDLNFIFQNILQIVQQTQQMTMASTEHHYNNCVRKLFNGKEDVDVRMQDIEKILKS